MIIEHVLEIDLDENDPDSITIHGLTHDGIWVPIFRLPITEKLISGYRFPLLLKICKSGQESKLKELLDKQTVEQEVR